MDRAMDAWVDGGTLPRRPPVGRRRQRGFHGVHGAHQRVWAGSSEAAAGTAGRRHRLSLGLREALERRVRGGRPRRGRGGVGGQPHRLRDPPQPPRPGLGTGRRPARTAPAPGRPPAPATAASHLPGAAGAQGFPRACGSGKPRGLPRGRDAAPRPSFHPTARGISNRARQRGPAGSPQLSVPPGAAGGRRRRGRREEKTRRGGTPAAGLPPLPGAPTTELSTPGAPRQR